MNSLLATDSTWQRDRSKHLSSDRRRPTDYTDYWLWGLLTILM